jgi:hypothetical protein
MMITHTLTKVSSMASNGSLRVSQTPGSCKKGQTPTDQPVEAYQNTPDGLNLQLTPRSNSKFYENRRVPVHSF